MSKAERVLLRWRNDPVLFVEQALGAKPIAWQREALEALVTNDRLAIRSGHGVGKTTFLSWLVLWWLLLRTPAKIGCTAPSASQLESALWPEIASWAQKLPDGLREKVTVQKELIRMTDAPDNFAVARTARKESPEGLQGLHSKHMLFLLDEASGIDEKIFEVSEGTMSTPGAKIVMTGNPTRASGYFFNAFHEGRDRWWCRKVSVEEAEGPHIDKKMIDYYRETYGEESNVYRVRVQGEFPTADDDAVIPLWLVEAAVARDVKPTGQMVWGVDVAYFGNDRSTLAKRKGNTLLEPVKWYRQLDTSQFAGRIIQEWTEADERPEEILVDSIGYGAGVVDQLRHFGLPARGVNVAELPSASDKYLRKRDELWFQAREWFEEMDCSIPDDPSLIAELCSVKFHPPTAGVMKMKVYTKEEMRKIMPQLRSPDLAEAFLMTFGARTRPSQWSRAIEYPRNHVSMGLV